MARSRKAAAKNSVKVDFTGVESSGNVQEGRHIAEVKEVELKTSENTGNEYINWKLSAPGGMVYHTTSLQPQALWNLRNTLEAMGLEVPDSSLDLDLDAFPGMELGIEVEHETYQGKKRPRVIDVFPTDEGTEEEPDEEDEPDEEEEGEVTFEDLQEMDKDELLELAEEEGIKVLAKVKKNESKLRDFLADKLELSSEEDESEEEEEEPPKKSRRKGKKELKVGAEVSFEDDGEDIEGTIQSINKKEGFAVVDVDGEEWEVELEDISLA